MIDVDVEIKHTAKKQKLTTKSLPTTTRKTPRGSQSVVQSLGKYRLTYVCSSCVPRVNNIRIRWG